MCADDTWRTVFRNSSPTLLFLFQQHLRTNVLSRELWRGKERSVVFQNGSRYLFFFPAVERMQWYYRRCPSCKEVFFPIAAKRTEVKLLSAKVMVHENIGHHHLSWQHLDIAPSWRQMLLFCFCMQMIFQMMVTRISKDSSQKRIQEWATDAGMLESVVGERRMAEKARECGEPRPKCWTPKNSSGSWSLYIFIFFLSNDVVPYLCDVLFYFMPMYYIVIIKKRWLLHEEYSQIKMC